MPMRQPLRVGAKAPDFVLPRDGGGKVSLANLRGRKVALYFYPRADTAGCTKEALGFNALRKAFEKAETVVLGVSADPRKAIDKFRDKYSLSSALAFDETHGGGAAHLSHRLEQENRRDLAEGEGRWPCRGGVAVGEIVVSGGALTKR
jgi:peroxiredoxin